MTNIMTNSIRQQLDVPESVRKRGGHSMSVFTMSPNCAWLVTVGGAINSKNFVTFPNIVTLTEIGQYCIIRHTQMSLINSPSRLGIFISANVLLLSCRCI